MKEVILNEMELFRNMAEIALNSNVNLDLHNDYNCYKISFEKIEKQLSLFFQKVNNLDIPAFIVVKFKEASICKIELNISEVRDVLTLDNMYRGRFEVNGALVEYSSDKKSYFYIDFIENISIELLAEEVIILSE